MYNERLEVSSFPYIREKINKHWNEISMIFATYAPERDGVAFTGNLVLNSLRSEVDSSKRKTLWELYMSKGEVIEEKLINLTKLRNSVALEKGSENFFHLKLASQDLNIKDLLSFISNIRSSLDSTYKNIMNEINDEITSKFKLHSSKYIRPWHYEHPFFQHYKTENFNSNINIENIEGFFHSLNLNISTLINKGDLFEKKNKSTESFCLNIDRKDDVRISTNFKNDFQSIITLFHELGHGVYERNIDSNLPFLLRKPSEIFMTESVALFFERLGYKHFIKENNFRRTYYKNLLVKVYWTITVTLFEIELYNAPEKNLNRIWWELVQEIQGISPPDNWNYPYWACKSHISTLPAYYYNYLIGEIIASNLYESNVKYDRDGNLTIDVKHLQKNLFKPGYSLPWKTLLYNTLERDMRSNDLTEDIKLNLSI